MEMNEKLLQINNLRVSFLQGDRRLEVIRGFDTAISKGTILGILGESGSGKTVSFSSILGLIDEEAGQVDAGEAIFNGKNLLALSERELREIRGSRISYIFQSPAQALNPSISVGRQMAAFLQAHGVPPSKQFIIKTLEDVGISDPETVFGMYPFQLSGGQNQRIVIAFGILLQPEIMIADEPTSSIDASLRRKILDLFRKINDETGMAIIVITHDFDVVNYLCDRVLVMNGGLLMEEGSVDDVLINPMHPYTDELIRCTQSLKSGGEKLYSLEGRPPSPTEFRDECPFVSRCRDAREECRKSIPEVVISGGRIVRCLNIRGNND